MADGDRFDSIKTEWNQALEARIGHLLGVVRAAQSITRQILATEDEIRRQSTLMDQLETEFKPFQGDRGKLSTAAQDLQRRLEATKADLARQRALHEELLGKLAAARQAGLADD
jgi:hypothetical protein